MAEMRSVKILLEQDGRLMAARTCITQQDPTKRYKKSRSRRNVHIFWTIVVNGAFRDRKAFL
jgi:hypothetical protein